jgi:hypothetical protein
MEVVALEVEGGDFRLGDLDALGIGAGVKFAGDGAAVLNATESQSQIGAWVVGA